MRTASSPLQRHSISSAFTTPKPRTRLVSRSARSASQSTGKVLTAYEIFKAGADWEHRVLALRNKLAKQGSVSTAESGQDFGVFLAQVFAREPQEARQKAFIREYAQAHGGPLMPVALYLALQGKLGALTVSPARQTLAAQALSEAITSNASLRIDYTHFRENKASPVHQGKTPVHHPIFSTPDGVSKTVPAASPLIMTHGSMHGDDADEAPVMMRFNPMWLDTGIGAGGGGGGGGGSLTGPSPRKQLLRDTKEINLSSSLPGSSAVPSSLAQTASGPLVSVLKAMGISDSLSLSYEALLQLRQKLDQWRNATALFNENRSVELSSGLTLQVEPLIGELERRAGPARMRENVEFLRALSKGTATDQHVRALTDEYIRDTHKQINISAALRRSIIERVDLGERPEELFRKAGEEVAGMVAAPQGLLTRLIDDLLEALGRLPQRVFDQGLFTTPGRKPSTQ